MKLISKILHTGHLKAIVGQLTISYTYILFLLFLGLNQNQLTQLRLSIPSFWIATNFDHYFLDILQNHEIQLYLVKTYGKLQMKIAFILHICLAARIVSKFYSKFEVINARLR
jgi:hypothetical protein